ncbi:MAG: O-acetyl-ADP-ribose deacetylase [Varibaculum sp.]|nr:O-acetyl-ADP-ribose deacetylase [Varibaculum sp.]
MTIRVIAADITKLRVDAIVNAANSTLLGGGGVDGAIHRAAGPRLLKACAELRTSAWPDGLPTGQAVITPAFDLPARYVIHTVGPNRHRGQVDPELLASCFRSSAQLAVDSDCRTVAFPAISAGVYGWDMATVAGIGLETLSVFDALLDVTIALFSEGARGIWAAELARQSARAQ